MLDGVVPMVFSVIAAAALATATPLGAQAQEAQSVLDFTVKSNDGQDVDLSNYKGDVLLIVNTASQCGYTPQYEGLQDLYEKYKDRGLKVLAFPANEFGGQEPGSDAEIRAFCTNRYNVTFPLFSKIVVKGEGQHPLYRFLTSKETNGEFGGEIPWNFTKFLVDREGRVIARFAPKDAPESPQVVSAIEKALEQPK